MLSFLRTVCLRWLYTCRTPCFFFFFIRRQDIRHVPPGRFVFPGRVYTLWVCIVYTPCLRDCFAAQNDAHLYCFFFVCLFGVCELYVKLGLSVPASHGRKALSKLASGNSLKTKGVGNSIIPLYRSIEAQRDRKDTRLQCTACIFQRSAVLSGIRLECRLMLHIPMPINCVLLSRNASKGTFGERCLVTCCNALANVYAGV